MSCLLMAFQANAVTINGINYKQFAGSGNTCPNGSKVYVYKNVKYCKAYRANISWNIPTKRTNGAVLRMSELKGYEIYWTRTGDNARGTIKVNTNSQVSTAFDVYTPSTYYFAVSAIDTRGLKSPLSTMVQARLGK
ncbi:MAG TPA: hypothetical protein VGK97_01860 [Spongiibacteraceae bacterium]